MILPNKVLMHDHYTKTLGPVPGDPDDHGQTTTLTWIKKGAIPKPNQGKSQLKKAEAIKLDSALLLTVCGVR